MSCSRKSSKLVRMPNYETSYGSTMFAILNRIFSNRNEFYNSTSDSSLFSKIDALNLVKNKITVRKLMLNPTSFWDFFDTVQWSR